ILQFFDADRITVYLADPSKRQIFSIFKTGDEVREIRVDIGAKSIAGFCAATGKLVNVKDAYNESELKRIHPALSFDRTWDQKTGFRTKQVLAVPIIYKGYLLGVLQLINKKSGRVFTCYDEEAAQDVAKVLGISIYKNDDLVRRPKASQFDYLISRNIISAGDLAEAMKTARATQRTVASILMDVYNVRKGDIGESLSEFYKVPFVTYQDSWNPPRHLLPKGLKSSYLKNYEFVPFSEDDTSIMVAMTNPSNLATKDAIKRIFVGKKIGYCVSLKEDIEKMIDVLFGQFPQDVIKEVGSIEELVGKLASEQHEEEEEITSRVSEQDSVVVQLVNQMIIDAYRQNASDIHIEPRPGKNKTIIRFRIDGACRVYQAIPHTYERAIVSRIKIMSDLDISERRLPQDGKIKFRKFAPLDIELRVATIPTQGGKEDVVLRLLHSGKPIPLEQMGMAESVYRSFVDLITKPYGLVLVVGPTGSGKTTTLHAALSYINKPDKKIWTAEDPVEITQEGLRQVQVQPKIGLTFAAAMRAFLRADPDVIMVGEMRDHETASTGIEASLTGHLVFSTLHTNSAPETITRLLDMGLDPFNFADALLGILAQRLVRTLCSACKDPYHPSQEEFEALVHAFGGDFSRLGIQYTQDLILYRPKGCPKCGNTGYKGRTGIHELLVGTDPIKKLIQSKAPIDELRAQAIRDGMLTLMQDGIRKVFLGLTTFDQVRAVCLR
ncbi:MAG: GspE/PulE family protein, partial [Desulfatiglandales bacterium]